MKLIAETAWHHQGDFDFMRNLVNVLIEHGHEDIVKCHLTVDLDAYMLPDHPAYETLSQWLLPPEQWTALFSDITKSSKALMLLYNDIRAVELGQTFAPALVEIHAVNLNNIHLLDALRNNLSTDQKVVIGVGGSSLEEIDAAIHRLDTDQIVLMFGFQNYPTRFEKINFARMRRIMKLYPEFEFGYADHCGFDEPNNLLVTLLGAAQGCAYVEKHVTTRFGEKRCDYEAAVSIDMLNELKEKLEILEQCNGDGALPLSPDERKYRQFGIMKSLALSVRKIKAGTELHPDMIRFVRTSQSSNMSQLDVEQNLGKLMNSDIPPGTPIEHKHFST
jgi:N,N'-diacetyllegionaminate synthase